MINHPSTQRRISASDLRYFEGSRSNLGTRIEANRVYGQQIAKQFAKLSRKGVKVAAVEAVEADRVLDV